MSSRGVSGSGQCRRRRVWCRWRDAAAARSAARRCFTTPEFHRARMPRAKPIRARQRHHCQCHRRGGEHGAGVDGGVAQCPVHISGSPEGGQFHGVDHLLPHLFGTGRGSFFEPGRCALPDCEEHPVFDGAGPNPVIPRCFGVRAGEMVIIDRRGTAGGAGVAGPPISPPSMTAQMITSPPPPE